MPLEFFASCADQVKRIYERGVDGRDKHGHDILRLSSCADLIRASTSWTWMAATRAAMTAN